jgi:hypothetical protein
MISDGAPVDDSTLASNDDGGLLLWHLAAAERAAWEAGMVVGFLLLGGEHWRLPALHQQAEEPEAAGLAMLRLMRRALLEAGWVRSGCRGSLTPNLGCAPRASYARLDRPALRRPRSGPGQALSPEGRCKGARGGRFAAWRAPGSLGLRMPEQ